MNRWEYAEVTWTPQKVSLNFFTLQGTQQHVLPVSNWGATFAQLGREGWELVSAIVSPTGVHEYWYYFKRPVQ